MSHSEICIFCASCLCSTDVKVLLGECVKKLRYKER